jgi:hypothetical protein
MLRRGVARASCAVFALITAWAMVLGGTQSVYTASATSASNSFTAATDGVAPTAGTSAIGRTTAFDTGYIAKSASYYVYANVTDTGNPASGTSTVTANVNSITVGSTAAALTAGAYTAGGASYNYRSAALTASSTLSAGTASYQLTATDTAANSGTQSFTTTVDNTAPTGVDVQSTNVSGGTVGHLELGDTLTLTYSKAIDPPSIMSGWDGTATTAVQITVTGTGSSNDIIQVSTIGASPVQLPLGTINLGSKEYKNGTVTYGGNGATTASTMMRNGASITLTLGSSNGPSVTSTTPAAMTWTPSASATDIAGNAASITNAVQSGTLHVNF